MKAPEQTLEALAAISQSTLDGDPDLRIHDLAAPEDAGPGMLCFVSDAYAHVLSTTKASVVLLTQQMRAHFPGPALIHPNPRLAFARIAQRFARDRHPWPEPGVHPTACLHPQATVAPTASVGPYAVVDAGAVIADHVRIESHVRVGSGACIGPHSHLHSHVVIGHDVILADHVVVQPHAVVGSEGFGFEPDEQGHWQKVPQLGTVRVGSHCDIGAHTTIDRGALGDTVLGDGVLLDNHIQIAHNVHIGAHTAIAACTGVAGSAIIGAHCLIGGHSGINGHIHLVDRTHITGMSMVTRSTKKPGVYSSGIPACENTLWRKNSVRFHNLDALAQRVRTLEKALKEKKT